MVSSSVHLIQELLLEQADIQSPTFSKLFRLPPHPWNQNGSQLSLVALRNHLKTFLTSQAPSSIGREQASKVFEPFGLSDPAAVAKSFCICLWYSLDQRESNRPASASSFTSSTNSSGEVLQSLLVFSKELANPSSRQSSMVFSMSKP